ncbi:hypothetical protein DFJ74DRAFT_612240 [Hyaloraphidium curvatum]|nr:hypothetical protein DFJ74DRAFT_612240 [Hyaloraphidium curvatum]
MPAREAPRFVTPVLPGRPHAYYGALHVRPDQLRKEQKDVDAPIAPTPASPATPPEPRRPPNEVADAAAAGDAGRLEALLDGGGALNSAAPNAPLPLHAAASRGHAAAVALLLDRGAIADLANGEGETALSLAALNGHDAVVQLLLDRGADPRLPDRDGWSPLHNACSRGHLACARLLLAAGADPNARNGTATTPLMSAAPHPPLIPALLAAGADPLLRNQFGESAYDLAAQAELSLSCTLLAAAEDPPVPAAERTAELAVLHENQRSAVLSRTFSPSNLSRSDPGGAWSTPSGAPAHPDAYRVPEGWYWLGEWKVDPSREGTDAEGWDYARSFDATEWAAGMPSNPGLGSWVRRRRWIRAMKRRREGEPQGGRRAEGGALPAADDYLAKAKAMLAEGGGETDQGRTERAIEVLLAGISRDREGKRKAEAAALARRLLEEAEEAAAAAPAPTVSPDEQDGAGLGDEADAADASAPELDAEPTPEGPPSPLSQGPATTWQLDEDAPVCNGCGKRFGLFLRRHHCRWCGKIFCAACASRRIPFNRREPDIVHRVDDACHAYLTSPDSPLLQRPLRTSRSRGGASPSPNPLPRIAVRAPTSPTGTAEPPSAVDSLVLCPACGTSLLAFPTEEAREKHMRECFERNTSRGIGDRYVTRVLDEGMPGKECGICFVGGVRCGATTNR